MRIVRGAYHFRTKPVAFRDDYCLSCGAPRRSIAVRSVDVGHIFWIPILPVLFWVAPVDSEFAVGSWIGRIAAPAGAILLLSRLLRAPTPFSLRKKLASIPPTADTVCPFCSIPLVAGTGDRWSCPACNAVRY